MFYSGMDLKVPMLARDWKKKVKIRTHINMYPSLILIILVQVAHMKRDDPGGHTIMKNAIQLMKSSMMAV